MGRHKSMKYYGVRVGRDGPNVYNEWPKCERAVTRFPKAVHKSFKSETEARLWVEEGMDEWIAYCAMNEHITKTYGAVSGHYDCDEKDEPLSPDETEDELNSTPRAIATRSDRYEIPSSSPSCSNSISSEDIDDTTANIILPSPNASPTKPTEENIKLSYTQQLVFDKVVKGENVFFTGSAGTGKSVLLREIIKYFGGPSDTLAVTASTGIAGVNIGGSTLHSFAGIGLGKEKLKTLIDRLKYNRPVLRRWTRVKRLIIDEVSMLDGSLFDKIEGLARALRENDSPFGGIQLILSGDFCQLPPVPDRHDGMPLPVTFAFDANSWKQCIKQPIILERVFRQSDQTFITLLNNMRFGKLDDDAVKRITSLRRPVVYDDEIEPTELYPLRIEVEKANHQRLQRLPDPTHTYIAEERPGIDVRGNVVSQTTMRTLLDRLVAPREITLKIGAQVMLVKNLQQGHLVNGSLGKVVDFRSVGEAVHMGTQIATDDPEGKSLIGKKLGLNPNGNVHGDATNRNGVVGRKEDNNHLYSCNRVWPVVRFTNGRIAACVPTEFTVVSASGVTEATREQVPLILAWAISVHKSQGQTLERVKVDLGRTFEKGQAYVALSRATSLDRLQVLKFDRSKVVAHPRVIQFYKTLQDEIAKVEEEQILREMEDEVMMRKVFEDDYDLSF